MHWQEARGSRRPPAAPRVRHVNLRLGRPPALRGLLSLALNAQQDRSGLQVLTLNNISNNVQPELLTVKCELHFIKLLPLTYKPGKSSSLIQKIPRKLDILNPTSFPRQRNYEYFFLTLSRGLSRPSRPSILSTAAFPATSSPLDSATTSSPCTSLVAPSSSWVIFPTSFCALRRGTRHSWRGASR